MKKHNRRDCGKSMNEGRSRMRRSLTRGRRFFEEDEGNSSIEKVSYLPSEYYYGGKEDDSVFNSALNKFKSICNKHSGAEFDIDFAQDTPYEADYKGKKLYGMGFHLRLYIHEDKYESVLPSIYWAGIIWDFGSDGLGFHDVDDSVNVSNNFRANRTNASDLSVLGDSLAVAGDGISSFGKAMEDILGAYDEF